MREEQTLAEIEDFLEGFNQPTYRGMRINGVRVATWSSQHVWGPGTVGRMRSGSNRSLSRSSYLRPRMTASKPMITPIRPVRLVTIVAVHERRISRRPLRSAQRAKRSSVTPLFSQ